jgi:hypothetical protein
LSGEFHTSKELYSLLFASENFNRIPERRMEYLWTRIREVRTGGNRGQLVPLQGEGEKREKKKKKKRIGVSWQNENNTKDACTAVEVGQV